MEHPNVPPYPAARHLTCDRRHGILRNRKSEARTDESWHHTKYRKKQQ